MNEIDKINNNGSHKIIFYTDKFNHDMKGIHYLYSKKCIHLYSNLNGFELFSKIPNLSYFNPDLLELKEKDIIVSKIDKPDYSIYEKIINIFKYVCNEKTKLEFLCYLYYDTETNKFILDICDQIIEKASVKFTTTGKYDNNNRYIKYLQVHSHNTMTSSFSIIDDKDDKEKIPCFSGVVGSINDYTNINNVSDNWRIWTGLKFISVNSHDIFNYPKDNIKLLDKNTIKIIDNIIENSKKSIDVIPSGYSSNYYLNSFFNGQKFLKNEDDYDVDKAYEDYKNFNDIDII
jgi:hypothetical protein